MLLCQPSVAEAIVDHTRASHFHILSASERKRGLTCFDAFDSMRLSGTQLTIFRLRDLHFPALGAKHDTT